MKILVHPEVPHEVAGAADIVGSTETIIRTLREAPAGSRWAVGTEYHLVQRMAKTLPDKSIVDPLEGLLHVRYDVPDLAPKSLVVAGADRAR